MNLVAIYADYPQSGKSTCAHRLVDTHGFKRLSFATPLKKAVAATIRGTCYAQDVEMVDSQKDTLDEKLGCTPRDIMIAYGMAMRNVDPDFWVRILLRNAEYEMECGYNVVIDDLRFPNEAKALREFGSTIINVEKPTHGETNSMEGLLVDFDPDLLWVLEDGSHAKAYELVDNFAKGLK
jgi:hypothetical protein